MILGLDDFLLFAILGGIGFSLLAGPLGSFLIWRKMSFLTDTLSHSALLGIALSLFLHLHVLWGILFVSALIGLFLIYCEHKAKISLDTYLNIISSTSFSLGLLLLFVFKIPTYNIMSFLIGDILSLTSHDLILLYGLGSLCLIGLKLIWESSLLMTLSEDIALAENIPVTKLRMIYMILLMIVMGLGIKMLGVLLVGALFVIPPTCSRLFSKTPERMVILSILFSVTAILVGLAISFHFNLPTAPVIILSLSGFLVISKLGLSLKQ